MKKKSFKCELFLNLGLFLNLQLWHQKKRCGCCLLYLAHGQVIQTIRTVEDHTLDSQSFGQILGGLSLSCSCWTFRCTTQVQVKSTDLKAKVVDRRICHRSVFLNVVNHCSLLMSPGSCSICRSAA